MPQHATTYPRQLNLSSLTYFLFVINAGLEHEAWRSVTFDEVYEHLDKGDLISFLDTRLRSADLSIIGPDQKQGQLLLEAFRDFSGYTKERERRKLGVAQSGVCLVAAWTISIIQAGQWNIADPHFEEERRLYSPRPENILDFPPLPKE